MGYNTTMRYLLIILLTVLNSQSLEIIDDPYSDIEDYDKPTLYIIHTHCDDDCINVTEAGDAYNDDEEETEEEESEDTEEDDSIDLKYYYPWLFK